MTAYPLWPKMIKVAMKVLVIHGANVNLEASFHEANERIRSFAQGRGLKVEIFHSNHEGEVVEAIHRGRHEVDAIIINPGDFFQSHPLRGAIEAVRGQVPIIEVRTGRMEGRGIPSLIGPVAMGVISGFGAESYLLGLEAVINLLKGE